MGTLPQNNESYLQMAALQEKLRKTTDCYKANAIEETLNRLLESITNGQKLTNKQINNMQRDGFRKSHKRKALLDKYYRPSSSESVAENRVAILQISRKVGPANFSVVVDNAMGFTFKEISERPNMASVSALKTRASRCRGDIALLAA